LQNTDRGSSLPGVTDRVQAVLGGIEKELLNLPDPPANALFTVNNVLVEFSQTFRRRIDGDPNDFSKAWKEIKKIFFHGIVVAQRPNLIVDELSSKRHTASEIICVDSDSDNNMPLPTTPSPSKKRKGARGPIATSFASPVSSASSAVDGKKRLQVEDRKYNSQKLFDFLRLTYL
jgi:hypothetical protein